MEKEDTVQKKNSKVLNQIFYNLIIAIISTIYFIFINFSYQKLNTATLELIMKISPIVIMAIGIIFLEISYKKDSDILAINGIEFLIIAIHSLLVKHITQVLNINFQLYILISSYLISIYYVLKSVIVYTNDRRKYLKTLSDIPEIVKDEEPIKKEATKKKEEKIEVKPKKRGRPKKEVKEND